MQLPIHPTSCVDSGAVIGEGTVIWHFCHIESGAIIGTKCVLGQNVYIGRKAIIGNNVSIQNNVSVYDNVVVESNVFLGPSVVFTNLRYPRIHSKRKDQITTLVKQYASIGANATIVCGITIGKFAMVGAGSVVTKDVPDYALVYGNPARINGWVCECGHKLELLPLGKAVCRNCSISFEIREGVFTREDSHRNRD